MNLKNVLIALALVGVMIGLVACGNKAQSESVANSPEDKSEVKVDTRYLINPDSCVSVSVLKDGAETILLNDEDATLVLAYLNSGVYNEERNDSDIKYKMPEADYTFLMEFANGKNELVQLWFETSLILLDAKWYTPLSAINIRPSLEEYTK